MSTKPISSDILRATLPFSPERVSRRFPRTLLACAIRRTGEVELSFWESVRESDNPALIQAYLQKYPNGEFSALAEIRIGELTPGSHRVIERGD